MAVFSESTVTTEVQNASSELMRVSCGHNLKSVESFGVSNYVYYSDEIILKNIGATSPSGEISLISVGLAVDAYNQERVQKVLSNLGFDTLYTSEYYSKQTAHDDNDVVAYSIADKYVKYKNEIYRIMVVPIRGTPESCEWYSDFNIGSGNQHEGFYTAANKVLKKLSEYAFNPTTNVDHTIIWTMGHSRGAAVSNIVAGEISINNSWSSLTSSDYVFGYTYACPAVSTTADTSLHNIFNYNNGGDVVPAMPLSDWGFKRFGQTIELPTSDYENLCQRFKEETGKDYEVGMTTVAYEQILKNLAETQYDFVNDDKIQLGVDMLSWFLGGKDDSSYKLLNVVLDHPSANAEMTGEIIKTTIFPQSTLRQMASNMTVANLQLMFESDLREYLELETELTTAISDTAEMSDVDSEDEETHKSYLKWVSWKSSHSGLISQVKDMTDVEIERKSDLYTARTAAGERYDDYNDIVSTIRDVLSLFYDTKGHLVAPFTQGHPQFTYQLWVNSMYYGCKGWYGNPSITTVNWKGRDQKTYAGDYCFSHCSELKSVFVPENISIMDYAFHNCSALSTVRFEGPNINIGMLAFSNCESIVDLAIPNEIGEIGVAAFQNCTSLTNLEAPYGYDCYIPDSRSSYSQFNGCSNIKKLTITGVRYGKDPNHVPWASASRSIEHVIFAEGITSLPGFICSQKSPLYSVKTIELPASLKTIEAYVDYPAFKTCSEKVIYHGTLQSWFDIDFKCAGSNPLENGCALYIGNEQVTDLVIPEGVATIKPYAFYHCDGLRCVTVPKDGTTIGEQSFQGCSGLSKVIISGNDVGIGYSAFDACDDLEQIDFTGSSTIINSFAFTRCISLSDIRFSDSAMEIGGLSFKGSSSLKKVVIPHGIKKIDSSAFYGCDNLTDIYYAGTEDEWKTILYGSGFDDYLNKVKIHYNSPTQATAVKGISLDVTEKTLAVEETFTLIPSIDPENATNKNVSWNSNAIGIADVDAEGLVTAVSPGEATITATTEDGGFSATCKVTVTSSEVHQHDLQKTDAVDATCEKAGNSAYWTCSTCGKYFADEDGKAEINENDWFIPASHKLVEHPAVEVGCETDGNVKYYNCSTCQKYFSGDDPTVEIKEDSWVIHKGHDWNDNWQTVEGDDSTCIHHGQEYDTCKRDSDHKRYRDKALNNHTLTHTDAISPTCTTDGNIEYWACSVCNKVFSDEDATVEIGIDSTVLPATHIWNNYYTVDVDSTCAKSGSESIHCSVCNAKKEESSREIPKKAHNYGAWRVTRNSTCTSSGAREKTCSECGDKVTESIPATGHSWTQYVSQNATEFSTGVLTHRCTKCGSSFNTAIPAITLPTDLPGVKMSKPKGAKGKLTVKWKKPKKKDLSRIQGIEIRVVGPGVDKITTAGKKKTSKKVGGLMKKQSYTVQVRTYAYIGGVKHVSAWSTKTAKTK